MADGTPHYGMPTGPLMEDGCWRQVGDRSRPCGQPVASERLGLCASHVRELRSW